MNRWLQLMLLMPEDEFITYKALSEELGISVRTVYDDITRLNEMMLEHGAQLVARTHHGVTLDVHDRARFLHFLDALGSGDTILGDTSLRGTPHQPLHAEEGSARRARIARYV